MLHAGVLLLIVGVVVWAVAYVLPTVPLLGRVGVVLVVIGALLLILGVCLPLVGHTAGP